MTSGDGYTNARGSAMGGDVLLTDILVLIVVEMSEWKLRGHGMEDLKCFMVEWLDDNGEISLPTFLLSVEVMFAQYGADFLQ